MTETNIDTVGNVLEYPYASVVPREPSKNLEWRNQMLQDAEASRGFRQKMLDMCSADSLFWVTGFCWLYEPRPSPKVLPFIPWGHQLPAWKTLEQWMGIRDVGLEKSRGEGASWIVLMLSLHKWLFVPMYSVGLVSKDESSADSPSNPDSLMWKLDWQVGAGRNFKGKGMLPWWMTPPLQRNINEHSLRNEKNNSTVTAYSSTGDVASGGRKTVMIMDELAKFPRPADREAMNSTQYVTDSRFLVSTPKGPEGAYFDAMHGQSNMVKVILDWQDNPVRRLGGYKVLIATTNERTVELVDYQYWMHRAKRSGAKCNTEGDVRRLAQLITDETANNPFAYEFMLTGQYVKHDKLRSPWYDTQCKRPGATPVGIAQELDRDYGGSTSRFFDISMITRIEKLCKPPVVQGEITVDPNVESYSDVQGASFMITHGGYLSLWFDPRGSGKPPKGRSYVVGADVAQGVAGNSSTCSALCVMDRLTGEQMAEYACATIDPLRFADYAAAVGYWFQDPHGIPAEIIWENHGPGASFCTKLTQMAYPNLWFRGVTEEYTSKATKKLGFWVTNKTKQPLLAHFATAVDTGICKINSQRCIEEAKFYINLPGGNVEHIVSQTTDDPSGASWNHGDRLVASALAWWVVRDYIGGIGSRAAVPVDTPPNCILARRREARKSKDKSEAWVPPSAKRIGKRGASPRRR
jgi:hypothetical protein